MFLCLAAAHASIFDILRQTFFDRISAWSFFFVSFVNFYQQTFFVTLCLILLHLSKMLTEIYLKQTQTQVFLMWICKIFKNTFAENLRWLRGRRAILNIQRNENSAWTPFSARKKNSSSFGLSDANLRWAKYVVHCAI